MHLVAAVAPPLGARFGLKYAMPIGQFYGCPNRNQRDQPRTVLIPVLDMIGGMSGTEARLEPPGLIPGLRSNRSVWTGLTVVSSCCVWDSGAKRTTLPAPLQQLGTEQYAANGQSAWEAVADYGSWHRRRHRIRRERSELVRCVDCTGKVGANGRGSCPRVDRIHRLTGCPCAPVKGAIFLK
jgi:hypothetical protein